MSMQVPVELLSEVVRGYGQSAYAVVSDPAGPPRVTHVMPTFSGETLTFGLGRTSCALLRTTLTSVCSGRHAHRDDEPHRRCGRARRCGDGTVTVRAAAAVRHRPAHDDG